MSKTLEEYGGRKSSAITTARRLGQFLGDDRLKDKGLVCNYITAWCAPATAYDDSAQVVFVQKDHACGQQPP